VEEQEEAQEEHQEVEELVC
jgi:hypothetical protein